MKAKYINDYGRSVIENAVFLMFLRKIHQMFLMFCVPGLSGYFIALSSSSPDHSSHIHASDTF